MQLKSIKVRFVWLILLLSCSACLSVQPAQADDVPPANVIGELIRRLVRPAVAPAPFPVPVRQGPLPPEQEVELRLKRLRDHAAVYVHWLNSVCSLTPEQLEQLAEFINTKIEKSQQEYQVNWGRDQNRGFSDYAPIRFTVDGAANNFFVGKSWDSQLEKLLTPEQSQQWRMAQGNRQAIADAAVRSRLLHLLDQELYFTTAQREQVAEHLKETVKSLDKSLYSLAGRNYSYYFSYQSPQHLLNGIPQGVLSEPQEQRWKAFRNHQVGNGPESEQYITFMSDHGVAKWYEMLDEAVVAQQARLGLMAELRIHYFASEFDLPQEQVNHLRTASKGTVLYCLDNWRESTRNQLRQWEQRMVEQAQFRQGNFGFSMSVPDARNFDQHSIWTSTISELGIQTQALGSARSEASRAATIRYLLKFLDDELWLSPEQHGRLTKALENKFPKQEIQGYEYMYEMVHLAIPLVRIEEAEVKEILNEEQWLVWENLLGEYKVQGRQIMLQMRNQGQFSFMIPQ